MRIELDAKTVEEIHWKAEKEYLYLKGFKKNLDILKEERRDPDNCELLFIEFEQDNTPEIGGDNIEVEYLKSLS